MKGRMSVQMRGVLVRRHTPSPFSPQGISLDGLVEMIGEMKKMHAEFSAGLSTIQNALSSLETIKEGKPGMPGAPGRSVSREDIEAAVAKLLRQPAPATGPSSEEVAHTVMASGVFYKLVKRHLKKVKSDEPAESGLKMQHIMEAVRIELSNRRLTIADIEGLEPAVAEIRNRSMRPYDPSPGNARGGGDTVVAGSGVTITNNGNGNKVISSTGGVTIKTPTGTVNGSNQIFGVTGQPVFVIADGITYFENNGYTYSALQILMTIPPSEYIRYSV